MGDLTYHPDPTTLLPADTLTAHELAAFLLSLPPDTPVFWPGGGGVGPQPIQRARLSEMRRTYRAWRGDDDEDEEWNWGQTIYEDKGIPAVVVW